MSYPPVSDEPQYGQQTSAQPWTETGGGFTDFAFSPREWGAVAAWAIGVVFLSISYFARWASIDLPGGELGLSEFMDVADDADTNLSTFSVIFIVASVLALIAAAAAIVLRGTLRLIGRVAAGATALLTLLFAFLLMSEISGDVFEAIPDEIGQGFSIGAYLAIFGAILLGLVAVLASRSDSAALQPTYGQPPSAGLPSYDAGQSPQ